MRIHVIAGMAMGLVLVGCGSSGGSGGSASPAPVDSAAGPGEVAREISECPANSPVRGPLLDKLEKYNGVFGHVYNQTSVRITIISQEGDDCWLDPGKGASYAGTSDLNKGERRFSSTYAPWRPSAVDDGDGETWLWMLVTPYPDYGVSGMAIGMDDPRAGWPSAGSIYRESNGRVCRKDDVLLQTNGLSEGGEYRLSGSSQGSVLVKRLEDSERIAREWMPGHTNTDDWARIDLYIERVPTNCVR